MNGPIRHERLEPVTASQASIFFDDQRVPPNSAYNVSTVVTVDGPLAPADLRRACRQFVRSVPALRLRVGLEVDTGEIVHSFSPEVVPVEWLDPAPTVEKADVDAVLAPHVRRPFEVDGGPLARLIVLPVAAERAVVAIVHHHLAGDGMSQSTLARLFALACTESLRAEHRSIYSTLVRLVRSAEETARQRDRGYWSARLCDAPPPPAGVEPDAQHPGQFRWRTNLDEDEVRKLEAVASELSVSPFHFLLAAVHHSLARYDDVPHQVCAVASQRPARHSFDHVVGCFVNQVPLPCPDAAERPVAELAGRHALAWRADLKRRNFAFGDLVNMYRARHGVAWGLGAVCVSYRREAPTLRWGDRNLRFTTDVFHRYYDTKTDLSIRFFHDNSNLAVEVERSLRVPTHRAVDLTDDIRRALRVDDRCGAERRS